MIIYYFYNAIAFLFTLFGLFFMNTFINDVLIPKSLRRSFETEMLIRFLIANLEGAIVIFILYQLNKRYLANINRPEGAAIANWTVTTAIVLLLIITAIVFYQIYKHDK